MQSVLRTWWWLPVMVVVALATMAAWLGGWLSDIARTEAAEAAGLPLDQVEADGLDITLTGLTTDDARREAVAAVEALDSSRAVTAEPPAPGTEPTDTDTDSATGNGAEANAFDEAATAVEATTADGAGAGADEPAGQTATGDAAAEEGAPTAAIRASFVADTMTIEGEVGDGPTAQRIVAAAVGTLGPDRVVDAVAVGDVATEGGVITVVGSPTTAAELAEWRAATTAMADAAGLDVVDDFDEVDVTAALNTLFELEPIQFEPREDTLTAESRATLDEAARLLLADAGGRPLKIVGHTDADGSSQRNQALSTRRAEAVVAYLIEAGVEAERLVAEGRGETELLVSPERTQADKQRNRRIEWEPSS